MYKKKLIVGLLVIVGFTLAGCETDNPAEGSRTGNQAADDWLIPVDLVFDGGPGKDGIPALLDPAKNEVLHASNDYLDDDDLILGFRSGEVVFGYPHDILDWHEIINDEIGGEALAVTYCPLTGTGIGWSRMINNQKTTFGVSGLLYNSNLIPYDRLTGSNWSQIGLKCVNGELIGTSPEVMPLIEMTWGEWKKLFPRSLIASTTTGYSRSYGNYPYGSYKTSSRLIFPVAPLDERLHEKERVLGVIVGEETRVYRFESFGSSTRVISDQIGELKLAIAGKADTYMLAFNTEIQPGVFLSLSPSPEDGLLKDQEGNEWDLFGYAVSGPRKGERLRAVTSFMGYWFSFAAFYPEPGIYR